MNTKFRFVLFVCTTLLAIPFMSSCTGKVTEPIAVDKAQDHLAQGDIYMEQGEMEEAVVEYGKAIELKPESVEAYHKRGVAYRTSGHYDLAIADLDRVLEIAPDLPKAYYDRSITYVMREELDAAVDDMNTAIRLEKVKYLTSLKGLALSASMRLGILAGSPGIPSE